MEPSCHRRPDRTLRDMISSTNKHKRPRLPVYPYPYADSVAVTHNFWFPAPAAAVPSVPFSVMPTYPVSEARVLLTAGQLAENARLSFVSASSTEADQVAINADEAAAVTLACFALRPAQKRKRVESGDATPESRASMPPPPPPPPRRLVAPMLHPPPPPLPPPPQLHRPALPPSGRMMARNGRMPPQQVAWLHPNRTNSNKLGALLASLRPKSG